MYDRVFWDQRYTGDTFVYGTEPNAFLKEHASRLEGPILSLGEGEGRNGVFLASRGFDVLGIDLSAVALAKARKLAEAKGVSLRTETADLSVYEPEAESFGAVVSLWAHLPGALRSRLYPRVERCLKPGGLLLLEHYSEAQLQRDTGGPKDRDMLMTAEKIRREFPGLEPVLLREIERDVDEGGGHSGPSSVVQFIGKKRG